MGKISYLYILYASTTNVLTDKKKKRQQTYRL